MKHARRRRAIAFRQQGGRCYWCGVRMVSIAYDSKGAHPPENACTLDHLDDRLGGQRRQRHDGRPRTVAACWKCNNLRGAEAVKRLPLAEIQRRSKRQHVPGGHPIHLATLEGYCGA